MFALFEFVGERKVRVERARMQNAIASSSVSFSRWLTGRVDVTVRGNGESRTIEVGTAHLRAILEAPDSHGPRSLDGGTSDSRYRENFLGTITFSPADEGTLVVTASALGESVSAFGVTRVGLLADLDALCIPSNSTLRR